MPKGKKNFFTLSPILLTLTPYTMMSLLENKTGGRNTELEYREN